MSAPPAADATGPVDTDADALTSFARRGFAVVRGIFSEPELELLRRDQASTNGAAPTAPGYTLYAIKAIGAPMRWQLDTKLLGLAERLAKVSDTSVDMVADAAYFDTSKVNLDVFHHDIEHVWFYQNPAQFVIVWVPIVKPSLAHGNLVILPHDNLAAIAPSVASATRGRGTDPHVIWTLDGAAHWFTNMTTGEAIRADFELDEVSECPHLAAGDALVMRGDLFHRTQAPTERRVAASFRLLRSEEPTTWAHLFKGGTSQRFRMAQSPETFLKVITGFLGASTGELHGRDIKPLFPGPLVRVAEAARVAFDCLQDEPRARELDELVRGIVSSEQPLTWGHRSLFWIRLAAVLEIAPPERLTTGGAAQGDAPCRVDNRFSNHPLIARARAAADLLRAALSDEEREKVSWFAEYSAGLPHRFSPGKVRVSDVFLQDQMILTIAKKLAAPLAALAFALHGLRTYDVA